MSFASDRAVRAANPVHVVGRLGAPSDTAAPPDTAMSAVIDRLRLAADRIDSARSNLRVGLERVRGPVPEAVRNAGQGTAVGYGGAIGTLLVLAEELENQAQGLEAEVEDLRAHV